MMRWIVGTSLKFRFLVIALGVGMILFGIDRYPDMAVDVFPEFAPPIVEIQTPALGYSPEDVEALVTVPLEDALAGLPGLDVMRSKSVPSLSSVKMIFEQGTDLLLARQMVQERIAQSKATIPSDVGPAFILQPLSATSRFLKVGITSDKIDMMDLSMLTYWKIQPALMKVPGVAHVAIWGERLDMFQVQVAMERLQEHGITLRNVMDTTSDAVEAGLMWYSDGAHIGTGGFIDTPNQRLGVRHILPIVHPDDLGEVTIEANDGRLWKLNEVANLVRDHQPMVGDGVVEEDIGLLLIVEKFPWANTLATTQGVEDALDAVRPSLPDVIIDHEIFRPATFIETAMDNLTEALLLGMVLVIVILCLFLYEWRTALISCVAIPLSLMAAGLVLYWQNVTINTMVLAGLIIALGAVVDDAIIDVENITRRLREAKKAGRKVNMFRIVLEASCEVRNAIIYATLIEVMALLPVFFMEGLSGSFFKPLAASYAYAILASMIVALTITPAMSMILLRNAPLEKRESPLVAWLHRGYDWILSKALRRAWPSYLAAGIIALSGLLVLPRMGQQLLPDFKERDFLMHWLLKPGASLPAMDRITIQGSKEISHLPGVRNFGAHIGQALIMDEVVGVYFGENWVSVDPTVPYDETVDLIQTTVDGYPGLYRDVLTYLKERIREVLTGSSEAITVRIYGRDIDVLKEKARELLQKMESIDGTIHVHMGHQDLVPQIEVEVDLAAVQAVGLKPGDVRRAASVMIAGQEAGDIFHGGRAYDINIWSVPEDRHSFTSVQNMLIDTPDGSTVRLADIADVRIVPTPNVIKRENQKRKLDVGCNIDDSRDLGSVVADVETAMNSIDWPLEYHPELLGEYAERQAAERSGRGFTVIAVLGIFALLYTSFGSFRLAFMAFLGLPTALVGGLLAAYLFTGIISLGSLVGFLTVLGIAARNGIMMINHFQHLEREEGEKFGLGLVRRGAQERLQPILMTATTTGLALLPLVIAGDIAGHEIELPMAIVILGGLVTSTLLNLFIIPPLYLKFGEGTAVAEEPVTEPTDRQAIRRAYG
jgi:CzcA family heavy metal efflux pump